MDCGKCGKLIHRKCGKLESVTFCYASYIAGYMDCGKCGKLIHKFCGKLESVTFCYASYIAGYITGQSDVENVENLSTFSVDKFFECDRVEMLGKVIHMKVISETWSYFHYHSTKKEIDAKTRNTSDGVDWYIFSEENGHEKIVIHNLCG
jgi:hypothetical protein